MKNKNLIQKGGSVLAVFLGVFLLANTALANSFNKNNIISDEELNNYNSMSRGYIAEFLREKGSGLYGLLFPTDNGDKTAADIFYDAAQAYKVNPKLLIATAQKEQSAITDGTLSENQKNKLMGYGVFPGSDPSEYLGVHNQIRRSAWQFRRYMDRHENYTHQEGKTTTTNDGQEITPENKATAGLYNYTPYVGGETGIGGNYLFWSIWKDWFQANRPSGTLIREIGTPGVYLLKNGKKYAFWYRGVFESRKFQMDEVVDIPSSEMSNYPTIGPIKFSTGTLIRSPGGTVYIIDDQQRRGFASREVFDRLGYNMDSVFDANWGEVNLYPEGEAIRGVDAVHANGTLFKSPYNGAILQLWDGKLRPVVDRSIFDRRFKWQDVVEVSAEVFDLYPFGESVKMPDGTLIRGSDGKAYIIENEKRRHLARPSVFYGFGFKLENIIDVPDHVINIHELGEALETS